MNRLSNILRSLSAITLASALCMSTRANDGTLLLDGRILVEGSSLSDASVTVFQDAVQQTTLTKSLDAFELKLALGHSYTLVFNKPGYVTKELLFDTNTPMDVQKGSVFTFRFQVALNPNAEAGEFRYDGPLAIIKFDSNEGEFGYDRQHVAPQLVKATPAPRKRREAQAFVDPTAPLDAWVAEKRVEN